MPKWHATPGEPTETVCPFCGRVTGERTLGEERACEDCKQARVRTARRTRNLKEMVRKSAAKGRPVVFYGQACEDSVYKQGGMYYRVTTAKEAQEIVELRKELGMPAVLGPDGRWQTE